MKCDFSNVENLNLLGLEGWEAVGATDTGTGSGITVKVLLKREIPDE